MWWRTLYPLRYLYLENSEKKRIDLVPSLVLALLITLPFVLMPGVSYFKPNGFLDKIIALSSALTGFYVAALVAAATFQHSDLDKVIRVGSIFLITKDVDGNRVRELITRREFVCAIFGYLAFAAFVLSVIAAMLIGISGAHLAKLSEISYFGALFRDDTWLVLRAIVIYAVSFLVSHVTVVTSLGLYYLMDRLHARDREIITKKSSKPDEAA